METTCLIKYIELAFNRLLTLYKKLDLYSNTDADAEADVNSQLPIPIFTNGLNILEVKKQIREHMLNLVTSTSFRYNSIIDFA